MITPGVNNANPNFPFFRVSRLGQKILADKESAYVHDVSSYEAALRSQVPKIHIEQLPSDVKEDFETVFAGVVSMIRTYRNDSGHPTGKFINREVCFVLINLFIASAKRIYALRDFYAA